MTRNIGSFAIWPTGKFPKKKPWVRPTMTSASFLRSSGAILNPGQEGYFDYINRWNNSLMGLVEARTLEALREKENHIIVFPQGYPVDSSSAISNRNVAVCSSPPDSNRPGGKQRL